MKFILIGTGGQVLEYLMKICQKVLKYLSKVLLVVGKERACANEFLSPVKLLAKSRQLLRLLGCSLVCFFFVDGNKYQ